MRRMAVPDVVDENSPRFGEEEMSIARRHALHLAITCIQLDGI